MVLENLLFW